jgi:hypothetical protein
VVTRKTTTELRVEGDQPENWVAVSLDSGSVMVTTAWAFGRLTAAGARDLASVLNRAANALDAGRPDID